MLSTNVSTITNNLEVTRNIQPRNHQLNSDNLYSPSDHTVNIHDKNGKQNSDMINGAHTSITYSVYDSTVGTGPSRVANSFARASRADRGRICVSSSDSSNSMFKEMDQFINSKPEHNHYDKANANEFSNNVCSSEIDSLHSLQLKKFISELPSLVFTWQKLMLGNHIITLILKLHYAMIGMSKKLVLLSQEQPLLKFIEGF
jgi:hypothetical protein